jgi:hypothetical protein
LWLRDNHGVVTRCYWFITWSDLHVIGEMPLVATEGCNCSR